MMRREWFTLGIHLGYRYDGSPICWPDGTPPPPDVAGTYKQTARPGHRAPHAWLADGRSTLDLFGRGICAAWASARPPTTPRRWLRRHASARCRLEFASLAEPKFAALYRAAKFVLVRPDGHVAWRDDRIPEDPLRVIDVVRGAARFPIGSIGI